MEFIGGVQRNNGDKPFELFALFQIALHQFGLWAMQLRCNL